MPLEPAHIPDGDPCPDGIGCNPATANCTTSEALPDSTCIPYERRGAPCDDASEHVRELAGRLREDALSAFESQGTVRK
ncbi:MAG TPA: hypothetical protein VF989_16880 [Polyangiaceae bacterium]